MKKIKIILGIGLAIIIVLIIVFATPLINVDQLEWIKDWIKELAATIFPQTDITDTGTTGEPGQFGLWAETKNLVGYIQIEDARNNLIITIKPRCLLMETYVGVTSDLNEILGGKDSPVLEELVYHGEHSPPTYKDIQIIIPMDDSWNAGDHVVVIVHAVVSCGIYSTETAWGCNSTVSPDSCEDSRGDKWGYYIEYEIQS